MVRALISWSLHNRFIVLLGTIGADYPRHLLGALTSTSRPIRIPTPPLVEVITQNPGASPEEMERADRHSARDGAQRDARAEVPAEHLAGGLERHQVPVRVRHRLLDGPPGSDQPDRHGRAICRPAFTPALSPWSPTGEIVRYVLEGRWLYAQPAQGGAGLGARTALQDRAGRDRRDRVSAGPSSSTRSCSTPS